MIKKNIKKIPIQLVLLTAIMVAMCEFFWVSIMSYRMLNEVAIGRNTILNKDILKGSLTHLIIINVSMTIIVVFIILVVTKIFKSMNSYAFYSCVTGLPNKNYVLKSLIDEISRIQEFSALISLDMDNFKAVNDTLVHLLVLMLSQDWLLHNPHFCHQ